MAATTFFDIAMIACARIVTPWAAVALQQQRRMVGRPWLPLSAWPPVATVIGTE